MLQISIPLTFLSSLPLTLSFCLSSHSASQTVCLYVCRLFNGMPLLLSLSLSLSSHLFVQFTFHMYGCGSNMEMLCTCETCAVHRKSTNHIRFNVTVGPITTTKIVLKSYLFILYEGFRRLVQNICRGQKFILYHLFPLFPQQQLFELTFLIVLCIWLKSNRYS